MQQSFAIIEKRLYTSNIFCVAFIILTAQKEQPDDDDDDDDDEDLRHREGGEGEGVELLAEDLLSLLQHGQP